MGSEMCIRDRVINSESSPARSRHAACWLCMDARSNCHEYGTEYHECPSPLQKPNVKNGYNLGFCMQIDFSLMMSNEPTHYGWREHLHFFPELCSTLMEVSKAHPQEQKYTRNFQNAMLSAWSHRSAITTTCRESNQR